MNIELCKLPAVNNISSPVLFICSGVLVLFICSGGHHKNRNLVWLRAILCLLLQRTISFQITLVPRHPASPRLSSLGTHGNRRCGADWTARVFHFSFLSFFLSVFLSFFLGFRRPNLITGPSGWRTPD